MTDIDLRVTAARIKNYRCLKRIELELEELTVLVGENNSGKTSLLYALAAALGSRARSLEQDDVYISEGEKQAPRDREIIIDVRLQPANGQSFSSRWTKHWGDVINLDPDGPEFVAFRLRRLWNEKDGEFRTYRVFLDDWPASIDEMETASEKASATVGLTQLTPVTLHLVDAQRDIVRDLRAKRSFWGRLVEDFHLEDDQLAQLEGKLEEVNQEIVENSPVLAHIQDQLAALSRALGSHDDAVELTPVVRQLRDISEGMDILFSTRDSEAFPVQRHGMGTRSLASILTYRAFTAWELREGATRLMHPFIALEEPEAHLHPHAQRALLKEVLNIPGQKIISTHSPYIVSQSPVQALRHLNRTGSVTQISNVGTELLALTADGRRDIRQAVLRTRGELAFARAIILVEGMTEEDLLPGLAEAFWGHEPNSIGLSIIQVHGQRFRPFVLFANAMDIPWFILSDGETQTRNAVENVIQLSGIDEEPEECVRTEVLPEGETLEVHLIEEGYSSEMEEAINRVEGQGGYIDGFIEQMHGQELSGDETRDYKSEGGRERAILHAFSRKKAQYAKELTRVLLRRRPGIDAIPPAVQRLFAGVVSETNLKTEGRGSDDD